MAPDHRPRVVTLGTAGGPRWWRDPSGRPRFGIATAVVVGPRWYLVDCGMGAGAQAAAAGLPLADLGAVLITHLHSDHTVDLPALLLFGGFELAGVERDPIPIVGPGDRGRLTPVSSRAVTQPVPVSGHQPTPGIAGLVGGLVDAYAADLNDRIMDSLVRGPDELFAPREILIPDGLGYDPDTCVAPDMAPIEVFSDDTVTISAVLVSHHPTAPAFAFRFDTGHGSVTISGDTAPCANIVRLARGCDLLLHEAIDLDAMVSNYDESQIRAATMDHHRRAHTTPVQAGWIATEAEVGHLALHHLVPSFAPAEAWQQARRSYTGLFSVPDDLDVIPFGDEPETARRDASRSRPWAATTTS